MMGRWALVCAGLQSHPGVRMTAKHPTYQLGDATGASQRRTS